LKGSAGSSDRAHLLGVGNGGDTDGMIVMACLPGTGPVPRPANKRIVRR
jgi:hypothetical protein